MFSGLPSDPQDFSKNNTQNCPQLQGNSLKAAIPACVWRDFFISFQPQADSASLV
jgi:hypothetical protein